MSITITDLFCGAGGSSLGAEIAGATGKLALNHWARAIETHNTNFPNMDHDCADVSALTTARIRAYPHTDILLASPECTNHSVAKGGKRRKPKEANLFDQEPLSDDAQDRSRATMWDVCRFAEQKQLAGRPYKAIIVENVVDAYKWGPNDNGQLFQAWLSAVRAIGYLHEIVWLNSMFAGPVPQSRDRMYVVFWRKGARKPNLKITPPSWCPTCEKIVPGVQAFKKLDYIWGRYGPQYFYTCPECTNPAIPGAHTAEEAIDWSIPITKIGDREKPLKAATRERVKRGLERLLNHRPEVKIQPGKTPTPHTLPIVRTIQKGDRKVVLPVAGNTFERTPGNRARDAETQPLGTVHTTQEQALVMAPMGRRALRPADKAPAPTQATTSRAAVVTTEATTATLPRPGDAPATADDVACLAEPKGAVMRNNTGGAEMSTPTNEPIRTLTTGGHQSVIVPYNKGVEPRISDREPVSTLTCRDRLAMVVPFTRNGRPRDVSTDVIPTIATEGPPALAEVTLTDEDLDNCGFRMFAIPEIAAAMAMTAHKDGSAYIVKGTKSEQMAQYGNAVTPPAMEVLVSRVLDVIQ